MLTALCTALTGIWICSTLDHGIGERRRIVPNFEWGRADCGESGDL
jgi:hypothetical protein